MLWFSKGSSIIVPAILTLATVSSFLYQKTFFSSRFLDFVHFVNGLHVLATLYFVLFSGAGKKTVQYFILDVQKRELIRPLAMILTSFFVALVGLFFSQISTLAFVGLFLVSASMPRIHAFKQSEALLFRNTPIKRRPNLTRIFLFLSTFFSVLILLIQRNGESITASPLVKFLVLATVVISVTVWLYFHAAIKVNSKLHLTFIRFLNEPLAAFWPLANTTISCIHAFEYIFDVSARIHYRSDPKLSRILLFTIVSIIFASAHGLRYFTESTTNMPIWTHIVVALSIAANFIHFEADRILFKKGVSGGLNDQLFNLNKKVS